MIVSVDSSSPDKACGTSYNGVVSDTKSTIFNFDVPSSYSGKTCSLFFMLPKHEDLETSDYKLSGSGTTNWDSLVSTCDADTTYSNMPATSIHMNDFPLAPGTTYWVADHPCPAGKSMAFMMSADGIDLEYFQDYNPKPIGLYMRAC